MKDAIPVAFKKAYHHLCMWHIMSKLSVKVGQQFCVEGGFRSRLHKLVWSENMKPSEFENKWAALLQEFGLEGHKWLCKKYNIREKWIPTYFRHIPMSGLMKTISRSESIN